MIAGWTVRYGLIVLTEGFGADIGDRFDEIATWLGRLRLSPACSWLVTIGVVAGGVKGGIERVALVLMPTLFAIVLGLAIYAGTLDGSAGPATPTTSSPDFGKLFDWSVLRARGRAGLLQPEPRHGRDADPSRATSIVEEHLPTSSTVTIAAADIGVAFVAGLVVFPLIFALGPRREGGRQHGRRALHHAALRLRRDGRRRTRSWGCSSSER